MSIFKRMKDRIAGDRPGASPAVDSVLDQSAAEYISRAWACKNRNDWAGAVDNFGKAIECDPYISDAYYGLGVVFCISGHDEQAIANLDRALELCPNDARAMAERGLAHANLGNTWQAQEDYQDAIAIDPAYYAAHANLGNLFGQQQKPSDALKSYDLAVRLNPTDWNNYLRRGGAYASLGENQTAYDDFTTYLQRNPTGPYVELAQGHVSSLLQQGTYEPSQWSVQQHMWSEYVFLNLHDTVGDLVRKVQAENAYFVAIPLSSERYALESVYARLGLRLRLTEIADAIGRDVLQLRLEQLLDIWSPCTPISLQADKEQAKEASEQNKGCTLVLEGDDIVGVFNNRHDYMYPFFLPTVLFGKEYAFNREGRTAPFVPFRKCRYCEKTFAYYQPVFNDNWLVDYSCPGCNATPIPEWVEERLRPGKLSKTGFLGTDECLESVMERDSQQIEELGLTHDHIADALERLLDAAAEVYDEQIKDRIERSAAVGDQLAARIKRNDYVSVKRKAPKEAPIGGSSRWIGSIEEVEPLINEGNLPPADIGCLVDGFQVFLNVHMGYQYCPWSIHRRPWSIVLHAQPTRVETHGTFAHVFTIPNQSLLCRKEISYKYADRDFLILDRESGEYLKGPGLIAHLIREHHFFEGQDSPYRVDPELAARVLKLA